LKKDGVSFLIVREKQLDVRELLELTRGILGVGMKVLIARRVDVAIAAGAAGVHLSGGAGELTPGQVRGVMPGAFVSVSCHEVEEVRRARMGGADLILFAPVFGKSVGGEMVVGGVGLEKLREACVAAEGIPVLALGGVTAENASECVKVGAAGVAGIRMFFE
jgi:thiamine-phosphate pyrophosphorylase